MLRFGKVGPGAVALIVTLLLTMAGIATAREVSASTIIGGCFSCYELTHCAGNHHMDEYMYDFWDTGENPMHYECKPGLCSGKHIRCFDSQDALNVLTATEQLISERKWGELAHLIANSPRAELNVKRGAIQFSGCGGLMFGHIPLSRKDAARLTIEVALAEFTN